MIFASLKWTSSRASTVKTYLMYQMYASVSLAVLTVYSFNYALVSVFAGGKKPRAPDTTLQL